MPVVYDKTVLVLDDDPGVRLALLEILKQAGYSVSSVSDADEALALCKENPPGVMISDVRMPGKTGLEFFEALTALKLNIPVILISGHGTINSAVEAMRGGVSDYLVKPFSPSSLISAVHRAMKSSLFSDPPAQKDELKKPVATQDPAMLKLLKLAEVVAASQATILIEGESGTGKELFARLIHHQSPRARHPFIAINCAAVPEGLLESELFGYEKGAFTGALSRKPGKFELAHSGTLLLDEVGEMSLNLQAKLLRVIQEREVDLLGGRGPVALDIRVIATTNRSLWEEVKAGRFREDLYYRLNVFPLRLPPLRNRITDIPLLSNYFLRRGSAKYQKPVLQLSPETLSILTSRKWPGNIRELENVMERAVLLSENGIILPEHLMFEEEKSENQPCSSNSTGTVREAERALILETLEKTKANRTHAAKLLGVSIRTLRNKLNEYRDRPHEVKEI
ncbi:MAG: sigma-54-dependent Fis family transcriptional regulator [Nitrospirae bacterium]|nr:sigma-54-dependent Fis family transcriptional regulator [Nitrospirota bacterium]MBI3351833.1 sigma-54-dependent Fis family transcriptional regulator [Nitrospirota bacterium]